MVHSKTRTRKEADMTLLVYFIILLVFGLIMLTSASAVLGFELFGDHYFFIKRQVLFGVFPGIAACLFFSKIPYPLLRRLGVGLFFLSVLLLIAVFIPGIGSTNNTEAKSWLGIGGFSFQPVEAAKLALILFFAHMLALYKDKIQEGYQRFMVLLATAGIPMLLVVLQPDVGSLSVLFAITFGMLFLGNAKLSHLFLLFMAALVAFGLLIAIAPYRANRLLTFLQPELDPQGISYQIRQSYVAIGSGGIFGAGIGRSQQKHQYLPQAHSDSIFAVIGEEMGFIVVAGYFVLLYLIVKRGMRVAAHAPDQFGRLAVSGILIWFSFQTALNVGALVGLMPLTGLPLPFVSHGGSALIVALGAVGVMMNVSKEAR